MDHAHRSTFQIVFACALGALACSTVAIAVGYHIAYGIIAGLIVGYISYEYRDVLKAIPIAYRAAHGGGLSALNSFTIALKKWRARPHPFLYPSLIVTAPFYINAVYGWVLAGIFDLSDPALSTFLKIFIGLLAVPTLLLGFYEASWPLTTILVTFAFIGARVGEHSYWLPFVFPHSENQEALEVARLEQKGLRRQPLTYANTARWIAKGFGLTVLYFLWTGWGHLGRAIEATIIFVARFLWAMFKLIHAHERILCAIDGTLGGVIAYTFLIRPERSLAQNTVAVAFGVILGAGSGLLNYEIVSKRVLKVVPQPR